MSKSYWLTLIDVKNADEYKKYTTALQDILKKYGASYVSRACKVDLLEGRMKPRIVVIEFPGAGAAAACYADPDYKAIIPLRTGHADLDLAILESFDGPQP